MQSCCRPVRAVTVDAVWVVAFGLSAGGIAAVAGHAVMLAQGGGKGKPRRYRTGPAGLRYTAREGKVGRPAQH